MWIIAWIVVGFIAGLIARLLVPGRDPLGIIGTILVGIAGSFVGGLLASLIFYHHLALRPSGWIGSIVGAIVVLLIWRAATGRRGMFSRRRVLL